MGVIKNFIDGVANAKLLPVELSINNLDKPVKVRVYLKENGVVGKTLGTYAGKLEAFWSSEHDVMIKLYGLDLIPTTWDKHHISVERG